MGRAGGVESGQGGFGRIPSAGVSSQYSSLKEEIDSAGGRVLTSGRSIGGPEVEGVEREFAEFCGVPHAVAVASGTDALRFALITSEVGAGSEVVTSPFTFIATTEAISQAGARPVFADVEAESLTPDAERVAASITPRTKAVVPVHLYGQTAHKAPILALARQRGIAGIGDARQAHGARDGGRAPGAP